MTDSRWWTYLQRLMGDDNAMTAAKRAGISASNFSRWKKGANADPEFVVKIARAYHANVLEALVEAEFITEDEAGLTEVRVGEQELLRTIDMVSLMDELTRRVLQLKAEGPEGRKARAKVQQLPKRRADLNNLRGAASRRVKETYPETPDEGL
ncbi:hypothetical protein [Rhodococcus sp. NPDC127528]|uniref:hypothetical protein n=1 Tax=unclassified Rhodococcus (in: high G+C Gram-positive bacteria) TaxID=192944 RepID=UPI0036286217